MDILNNLNVVIGIIVGLFGIGGYIVGIIAYLRHKVTSSQQQTIQRQPSQRNFPQTAPKSLNKLDWMEVLWTGLEDCLRARGGRGLYGAFVVLLFGTLFPALFISKISQNAVVLYLAIFVVLYFTFIILFYVYFVGRKVEEKVEYINQTQTNKSRKPQIY